jgi:hypothetical protein
MTTGRWHGKRYYFGLHYDLHANASDTVLGKRCGLRELAPMLRRMAPDFVQTDCKGHPGMTSWFSRVPNATVSPGVVKDAMAQWRAATRRLGLPLHCHYSGVWDVAAGQKHPEWCIVGKDGQPVGAAFSSTQTNERMCPRSAYADELLIPQMKELIDRYGVDGFWVDGEIWAVEPCYCPKCRAAFTAQTGLAAPPKETTDPNWPAWINFTRESFEAYVTRYCDAIHAHKDGVLLCSNWLQTFKHPGEPKVPTDWISGDNAWVWGLDGSRCEARFISTRGKPWDIMLWNFYCSHGMGAPDSPWVTKPVAMLQQEAAVTLAFGGNIQIYENAGGLRDGRLIPWRQRRLREVSRFVKARRRLCQDTATIPQVAVLHSEAHVRAHMGRNLLWGVDAAAVQGAVFSLLECHYGVDVLDEWALTPRLAEFPVVVVPEQDLSAAMAGALRAYTAKGGKLLVTGAMAFDHFGAAFLGVQSVAVEEKRAHHVPAADGSVPLFSSAWRLLKPTGAKSLGTLGKTPLRESELRPHPAATLNRIGKGAVAYIPADVFRDFNRNRYPAVRVFIGEIMRALCGRLAIEVQAPTALDVVLRRQGNRRIVHFINRLSGIPNQPNNGAIDEIPPTGPVTLTLRGERKPRKVSLAFEKAKPKAAYQPAKQGGLLTITVPQIHLHAALVIK